MTGKEILNINIVDEMAGFKESIGDYIKDIVDGALCDEGVHDEIVKERKLTGDSKYDYDFYSDPIWIKAWNKKIDEMITVLKL